MYTEGEEAGIAVSKIPLQIQLMKQSTGLLPNTGKKSFTVPI